jgi:hypothetical protein
MARNRGHDYSIAVPVPFLAPHYILPVSLFVRLFVRLLVYSHQYVSLIA